MPALRDILTPSTLALVERYQQEQGASLTLPQVVDELLLKALTSEQAGLEPFVIPTREQPNELIYPPGAVRWGHHL